jgi:hypothetical protein
MHAAGHNRAARGRFLRDPRNGVRGNTHVRQHRNANHSWAKGSNAPPNFLVVEALGVHIQDADGDAL